MFWVEFGIVDLIDKKCQKKKQVSGCVVENYRNVIIVYSLHSPEEAMLFHPTVIQFSGSL